MPYNKSREMEESLVKLLDDPYIMSVKASIDQQAKNLIFGKGIFCFHINIVPVIPLLCT